jgi:hypothetical protein
MPQHTVRMGVHRRPGRAIAIGIAAVLVAGGAFAIAYIRFAGGSTEKRRMGCEADADCGAGRMCARNGCFPLAGTESADVWRADLNALQQLATSWRPRAAFGEKLASPQACPAAAAKANLLDPNKIALVHRTQIVEVGGERLRLLVQSKMRGMQWVEAMRFSFPGVRRIDPTRLCASAAVAGVAFDARRPDTVDAELVQSVPAGSVATATLSLEVDLPRADKDGLRAIEIPLASAPGEAAIVTVLALPLGTDVAKLSGPAPSRQRLLPGFVAYYWNHGKKPGKVTISLAIKPSRGLELSLDDVKP